MTSYFEYNDNKTRKPPARTEHGTEIVEIDSYLVTETPGYRFTNEPFIGSYPKLATEGCTSLRHGSGCRCWWCYPERGDDL